MEDESDVSIKTEPTEEFVITDANIVDIKYEEIPDEELPDDAQPPTLSLPETDNIHIHVQDLENLLGDIPEIKSMLGNSNPVAAKHVEQTVPDNNAKSSDNKTTEPALSDTNPKCSNIITAPTLPNSNMETIDDISTAPTLPDSNTETTNADFGQSMSNVQFIMKDKQTQTLEDYEIMDTVDHSLLQPPLNLGVKNVKQILTCVKSGSVEVQDILFNECNIIYECKVCHNLFRCLANLLSHKRFYCKDPYCKVYEQYKKRTEDAVTMVIEPESPPESYNDESNDLPNTPDAEDLEPPILTEIQKSAPKIFTPNSEKKRSFSRSPEGGDDKDETFIHLEHIKNNPNAVFQTVIETCDKIDTSISIGSDKGFESNSIEGNFLSTNNKIIANREQKLMKRSDCDIKNLLCLKCNVKFEGLKGLYVHMMTTHAGKRICYPCLYCKTVFTSVYGVGRHMMKMHNKSKEYVGRTRDLVKRRAFISKGPFPEIETNQNQEPKTETIVTPKTYPCNKCNRMFDRKTSQISHEKYCRVGCTDSTPAPVSHKKKDPQVRGPSIYRCTKCSRSFKLKSSQISHTKHCKGSTIKPTLTVKPKISKTVKPLPPKVIKIELQEDSCRPKRDVKKKKMGSEFVSSQSLKWRSANKVESVSGSKAGVLSVKDHKNIPAVFIKKPVHLPNPDRSPSQSKSMSPSRSPSQAKSMSPIRSPTQVKSPVRMSPQNRLPQALLTHQKSSSQAKLSPSIRKIPHSPKPNSVNIIEGRVSSIINAQKLSCLKCNRKFSTFSNLRRHAATHIGWMRFRCKHCNYKCFNRSDCRSHVQRMHPGTYTNIENIDRNIIKLATGKLKLRRDDLLSDSEKKTLSKLNKSEDIKETKAIIRATKIENVKGASPVRKTVKPDPIRLSALKKVEVKSPKLLQGPLKVMEMKPPRPITSVVLKTTPQEIASSEILSKTSPTKVREVVRINPPKPVTSVVLRTVPPDVVPPPHSPPTLFVKSSARKSTGGANPKILKRVLIPPPSQPLPKPSPSPPPPKTVPAVSPQVISLQVTPQKKFSLPSSLDSSPVASVPTKPGSPATTKPHVILLNARARLTKSGEMPTLVTRAGAYTKPILALKIPVKPSVKPRNGKDDDSGPKPIPNNQLPDHQYT